MIADMVSKFISLTAAVAITALIVGIATGAVGYAAFQFWRLWKYARSRG